MAYFALVPLAIAVQHAMPRRAFWLGWLAGTIAYVGILDWLIATFRAAHLSIMLAAVCLLLLAAYLGLYWGVWAWFISLKRGVIAGAAAWAALEFIRTHLFSGFPWALLADSQVGDLPRIQIACLTGAYGVSFVLVLSNLALASRTRRTILITFASVMVLYTGGIWRLLHHQPPARPHLIKVALLQGNIDQYNKCVPGYLLQDKPLRLWLEKTIRNSHTNHLIGAPILINEKAYNSAFSINNKSHLEGEYDKTHLVPFGEIVPWSSVLGRFVNVLNDLGGFTAGKRSPVISAAGMPVAVNICYEAIFPDLVRRSVLEGGQWIANLTNDGWYMKTSAPYQHWAPNILRAVENDRWVVRADNTGISGIIDPLGRVIRSAGIFETAIVMGNVTPLTDKTFYTRFGDLFAWICIVFCAASLLLYILRIP